MKLEGTAALVTGANRGLGRHFAEQLVQRGVHVYAAARRPETIDLPGVTPVRLDVTTGSSIAAAVAVARNISLLINNAGSYTGATLQDASLSEFRTEMEVHYFGTLEVTRAFAPVLARSPQSAVLNVLSALSWFTAPEFAPYAAAKSAEWSLTNALRIWLAQQNTRVTGVHMGYMDTDMVAQFDVSKVAPEDVARRALDAVVAGDAEVVVDEWARRAKAGLSGGIGAIYPEVA